MSRHIVDDEQYSDRRVSLMRPLDSGLAETSAALALLDDAQRHRVRRAALDLPLPGQERGPVYYSDGLVHVRIFNVMALSGRSSVMPPADPVKALPSPITDASGHGNAG